MPMQYLRSVPYEYEYTSLPIPIPRPIRTHPDSHPYPCPAMLSCGTMSCATLCDWCDKRASNPGEARRQSGPRGYGHYLRPTMALTPANGTDYSGTSSGHLTGRLGLLGVFAMLLSVITKRTEHIRVKDCLWVPLFRIWDRRTTELEPNVPGYECRPSTRGNPVRWRPPPLKSISLQHRATQGRGIVLPNHYGTVLYAYEAVLGNRPIETRPDGDILCDQKERI
jgi:hypothetical protein